MVIVAEVEGSLVPAHSAASHAPIHVDLLRVLVARERFSHSGLECVRDGTSSAAVDNITLIVGGALLHVVGRVDVLGGQLTGGRKSIIHESINLRSHVSLIVLHGNRIDKVLILARFREPLDVVVAGRVEARAVDGAELRGARTVQSDARHRRDHIRAVEQLHREVNGLSVRSRTELGHERGQHLPSLGNDHLEEVLLQISDDRLIELNLGAKGTARVVHIHLAPEAVAHSQDFVQLAGHDDLEVVRGQIVGRVGLSHPQLEAVVAARKCG